MNAALMQGRSGYELLGK